MTSLILILLLLCLFWRHRHPGYRRHRWGRRLGPPLSPPPIRRQRAKPKRIVNEVIRLKALHPDDGCRKIAGHFNRLHDRAGEESVSKSWVATVLRRHEYEIRVLRRRIKHRPGRIGRKNHIWGLDLTGKTDEAGRCHPVVGLIDHGTRASITLQALIDKSSVTLLRILLDTIERYGKPQAVRTDNETVFTSRFFRFGLSWLGIRHQHTDLHCPWMNGRIERFFGTLKHKLNRWAVSDRDALNASLVEFRLWYNHIRPHQHLKDRTPAEVWSDVDIFRRRPLKRVWFDAWDGLLTGYYLPP